MALGAVLATVSVAGGDRVGLRVRGSNGHPRRWFANAFAACKNTQTLGKFSAEEGLSVGQ